MMNKAKLMILLGVFFLYGLSIYDSFEGEAEEAAEAIEICEGVSDWAEAIIQERYEGVLMIDVLRRCNELTGNDESRTACHTMVMEAYDRPNWPVGSTSHTREVVSYINDVQMACVDSDESRELWMRFERAMQAW